MLYPSMTIAKEDILLGVSIVLTIGTMMVLFLRLAPGVTL
jgi:hypothetical protein